MWLVWNRTMRGEVTPSLEVMNPQSSMDWELRKQHVAQVIVVPVGIQDMNFHQIVAALPCTAEAS